MSYITFNEDSKSGYWFINLQNDDLGRLILAKAIDVVRNEALAAIEVYDCEGARKCTKMMSDINDALKEGEAADREAQGQQGVEVDTTE